MHCHCGTNNRAPRWTFTDPCKPEVRPGAREESASPAWLAAPAMNARNTTKVYIWRLDTGCGPTLYRKCHSHNTPGKGHNNTWVEPLSTESNSAHLSRVTVSCELPFTTNVTISTSISQTFRSWVAIFQLRQPMVFLSHSSYGMPGLAPLMKVLF